MWRCLTPSRKTNSMEIWEDFCTSRWSLTFRQCTGRGPRLWQILDVFSARLSTVAGRHVSWWWLSRRFWFWRADLTRSWHLYCTGQYYVLVDRRGACRTRAEDAAAECRWESSRAHRKKQRGQTSQIYCRRVIPHHPAGSIKWPRLTRSGRTRSQARRDPPMSVVTRNTMRSRQSR